MNPLRVAVHGLRAISSLLHDSSGQESAIKVLYHAVIILSNYSKEKKGLDCIEIAEIGLAAFQALGKVLSASAVKLTGKAEVAIVFTFQQLTGSKKSFFPVPCTRRKQASGSLSSQQVLKIGIQASLEIASMLSTLSCESMNSLRTQTKTRCDFGENVSVALERAKTFLFEDCQNIISEIVTPWIYFSSTIESQDDLVAFSKSSLRLLWDAASRVEKSTLKENLEQSLELRKSAILGLLMTTEATNEANEERVEISVTTQKLACDYAWKSAATYVQQSSVQLPVRKGACLFDFHSNVGRVLDSFRGTSTAYITFCAYRCHHVGVDCNPHENCHLKCLFSGLPFRFSHNNCYLYENRHQEMESLGVATLSAIFLMRSISNEMASLSCGQHGRKDIKQYVDAKALADKTNSVLDFLNSSLTHADTDARTTSLNLLSHHAFPRIAYKISDAIIVEQLSLFDTEVIRTLGRLLSNSLGPLAAYLINDSGSNAQSQKQYWDIAIESFIRSAVLLDRVRDHHDANENWLNALSSIHTLLLGHFAVPVDGVEKVAKTLFGIGKRHFEDSRPKEAILPMVYSTKLFSYLVDKEKESTLQIEKYQLTYRYISLASVFESLDKPEGHLIALLLALANEATEATSDGETCEASHHFDMLHYMAMSSNQIVFLGTERRNPRRKLRVSIINRLANTLIDRPVEVIDESHQGIDVTMCWLNNIILESAKDASNTLRLNVDSENLALAVFQSLRNSPSPNTTTMILCEELKMSLDLIVQLGRTARQTDQDPSEVKTKLSPVLREFKSALRLASKLSQLLFSSENSTIQLIALGMIYIVGLGALLESRPHNSLSTKLATLRYAKTLLNGAEDFMTQALEQATIECDTILSQVILASIKNIFFELRADERVGGYNETCLDLCEAATYGLLRTYSGEGDPKTITTISCLTWTINQMLYRVSRDGKELHALKLSGWNLKLSNLVSQPANKAWYTAVAGGQLLASGLVATANDILGSGDAFFEKLQSNSFDVGDLASLELLTIHIRVRLASSNIFGLETLALCLQSLLKSLPSLSVECENQRVISLWVASSVTLALVKVLEGTDAFDFALEHLKNCLKLCRKGIHTLELQAVSSKGLEPTSWVREVLPPSFSLRFIERQIECMKIASKIIAFQGNYRQAEMYALSALELSGLKVKSTSSRVSLEAVIEKCCTTKSIRQELCFRNLLNVMACASAADYVHKEIIQLPLAQPPCCSIGTPWSQLFAINLSLTSVLERIDRGDLLFGSMPGSNAFVEEYAGSIGKSQQISIPSSITTHFRQECQSYDTVSQQSIQYVILLRKIRMLLLETNDRLMVFELCTQIITSSFAPPHCRAWAYFYGGLLKLAEAKVSGNLYQLWEGHIAMTTDVEHQNIGSVSGEKALVTARTLFNQGLAVSGLAGSAILTRSLLRSLALVSGPSTKDYSTAALINSSIGSMLRQKIHRSIHDVGHTTNDAMRAIDELFHALDVGFIDLHKRRAATKELFAKAGKLLPSSWRIVSVSVCPTGEILLTSLCTSGDGTVEVDTACIFTNENLVTAIPDSTVYDNVVEPLDRLIQACEAQLTGMDEVTVNDHYSNESSKRDWWEKRDAIDTKIRLLIEDVDEKFFGSDRVRKLFLGNDTNTESTHLSCGNLASKFEHALSLADKDIRAKKPSLARFRIDLEKMTVGELKATLQGQGMDKKSYSKLRKTELINMLWENGSSEDITEVSRIINTTEKIDKMSLILILDENLHRFPMEGFSFLQGVAISRVPSLPFALAPLLDPKFGWVNASRAKYIFDPEGNLNKTAERLLPVVEAIVTRNGWKWDGIVGNMPTTNFMEAAISERNGLLLYCGHGGGQVCFSKSKVEKMIDMNLGSSNKSTLILMGCSSGKVVSVNRKGMKTFEQVPIHYEPEGIALSYLCAGAPCVVGNLWDVTDRDIDKFCTTLLESFLNGDGTRSMAKCVADARSSCKMKHLVGLAPICYGIPAYLALRLE